LVLTNFARRAKNVAMATWLDVSRPLKSLPAVVRSPGRREWRVKDKLLAWERPLRQSDRKALGPSAPTGPILAIHVPLDVKEMLLASHPEVYFTTPHFDGWPAVLIRLPAMPANQLREILHQSWLERAPKKLAAEFERAKASTRQRSKRTRRPSR
jgi:hypothetical protein